MNIKCFSLYALTLCFIFKSLSLIIAAEHQSNINGVNARNMKSSKDDRSLLTPDEEKIFDTSVKIMTNGTLFTSDGRKFSGKSAYVFSDGSSYIGDWKNGKRDGSGYSKFRNGEFSGHWGNDTYHGKGIITVYTQFGNRVYNGEWQYGKRQGKGDYSSEFGNSYRGEWKNNLPHGFGTFEEKYNIVNGSGVFCGWWNEGVRNGKGKFTLHMIGKAYDGQWREGKAYGNFKFYDREGNLMKTGPLDGENYLQLIESYSNIRKGFVEL